MHASAPVVHADLLILLSMFFTVELKEGRLKADGPKWGSEVTTVDPAVLMFVCIVREAVPLRVCISTHNHVL